MESRGRQAQYDPTANLDPPGKPPKPGGGSNMYPLHHAASLRRGPRPLACCALTRPRSFPTAPHPSGLCAGEATERLSQ